MNTDPKYIFKKAYTIDGTRVQIFKPPGICYGLDRLDKSKPVYLTEGTFDCLSFDNGVSFEGAAFGYEKLKAYRKSFPNDRRWVVDTDNAGYKTMEFLLSYGEKVYTVKKNLGKDPNDAKVKLGRQLMLIDLQPQQK